MGTPDGIADADWDRVHALTLDVVNAGTEQQQESARVCLLSCLDSLEEKYGVLPSILATRADFTDDLAVQEWLLLRALALAEERGDATNVLFITHSLAALYVEERQDVARGQERLDQLRQLLTLSTDSYFPGELQRLSTILKNLSER